MNEDIQHPLVARLLHWGIVISMLMMVLTGLYIHEPSWMPIFGDLGTVWPLHYIFAIILAGLVFIRIIYAAIIGDFNELLMKPKDVKGLWPVVKYYLFLSREEPDQGKYNAGQKLTYSAVWIPLLLIQIGTGIALYVDIGGLGLRIAHYIVTWLFIATIVAHIYLGFLHGWGTVKSMITGRT